MRAAGTLGVVGALALGACGQATQPGVGGLNGTNTVAVVRLAGQQNGKVVDALYGQLAIVTSSEGNELKAINLYTTSTDQPRDYVPAPNPLEALSIPVVDDPVELTAAVRYGPLATNLPEFPGGSLDGQERTGMLIFVRGAASPFISVVGAANVPESLRQLTNGLLQQSAGPVTAISARLTSSEQNVVLYYATFDGQDATVWERVLQHPATTDPSFAGNFPTSLTPVPDCLAPPAPLPPTTLYLCPPRAVRTYRSAAVSALQVLPTQVQRAPGGPPTGSIDTPLPVLCGTANSSGTGCASGGLEGGRLAVALRDLLPPSNNPLKLSVAGQVRIIDPAVPPEVDVDETSSDPLFRLARFFPNGPADNPFIVEPPVIPDAPVQPPVRQLLTHARAYNTTVPSINDAGPLPDGGWPILVYEGARLFGVVDESSCFGSSTCTGILAVDADPRLSDAGYNPNYGLLAFDDSDSLRDNGAGGQVSILEVGNTNRMLALRLGPGYATLSARIVSGGVIQGAAIAAEALFPSLNGLVLVPLLGIATVSGIGDGTAQVFFFDAVGLRFINESNPPGIASPGVTLNAPALGPTLIDGGTLPDGGPAFIQTSVGVGLYPWAETFNIFMNGPIPTLTLVQALPSTIVLSDAGQLLSWPVLDGGTVAAQAVLQPGDTVVPVNLSGTACTITIDNQTVQLITATVIGVEDAGSAILTEWIDLTQCPGVSGYSVQAGEFSAEPLLVSGSISGVIGRMACAFAPTFTGTYSCAPDGGTTPVFTVPNAITDALRVTYPRFYDPEVNAGVQIQGDLLIPPGAGPDGGTVVLPLTLTLPAVDSVFFTSPGASYSFTLSSGFLRASMPLDLTGIGFAGLYLPGGVAQTRIIDSRGEFVLVLIAYPSGNAVIDFTPAAIIPNNPNAGAIGVHF